MHRMVWLFTLQLSLVLTAPSHRGMARLSWPRWPVTWWRSLPTHRWLPIPVLTVSNVLVLIKYGEEIQLSQLTQLSQNNCRSIHLVDDPTIRQPGFALPRQQWSLPNRFHTGQGHCGACKKKWKLSDSDQCSCGETQTMTHTVESCPQTRLHGGLSKLHSADDDAVAWLTRYGS